MNALTNNTNTVSSGSVRQTGVVKFSDLARGFGFIAREGKADLFFLHRHQLADALRGPRTGERVSFDEIKGARGQQAINVCNLDNPESVAAFDEWMTPKRKAHRTDEADTQKRYEDYFKNRRTVRKQPAPVSVAPVSTDYMDSFYGVPTADDDASTQARDVRAVLHD